MKPHFPQRLHTLAAVATLLAATSGAAMADEYTIAVGKGLTGPLAFVGVPESNGIKMAIEELNARKFLGEHKLALTTNDDANDRGQAVSLLNRAVRSDNALVYLGTANSSMAIAIAPVLNDLKIPMFATAATAEPIKVSPWYFKITTPLTNHMTRLGKYAVEKVNIKRPALVFTRDNEAQLQNMRSFKAVLTDAGIKPVAEETVLTADTDYSAVATKIAASQPDSVWLGALAVQAANLAVQLKQAGVPANTIIFGTSGLGDDYLKAGGAAVENTYASGDYNVSQKSALNASFVENYKKRYGTMPDNWAAVGYSSALIAAEAIRKALPNPTREKVRDAILQLKDVPTVLGNGMWGIDANRNTVYDVSIIRLQGGKFSLAP